MAEEARMESESENMQKKSGGGLAADDRLERRHKWPKHRGGAQREEAELWSIYHLLVVRKCFRAHSQVRTVVAYISGFCLRGLPKERNRTFQRLCLPPILKGVIYSRALPA